MAPRNWKKHWRGYLSHYAMAGLAGTLVGSGHWPGVVLILVTFLYQLGSYWHTQDTLKRDLYDITLAFSVMFCIAFSLGLIDSIPGLKLYLPHGSQAGS